MFLFILNPICLAAKSIVSRRSHLFKRLLIANCTSSKWELTGQSFSLVGVALEEIRREAASRLAGRWEA